MKKTSIRVTSPADLGALVREAREQRGWTQTDLGTHIGASRFWVAAFERGKPGAELGLALRAAAAVGIQLRGERPEAARALAAPTRVVLGRARHTTTGNVPRGDPVVDLDEIVGTQPRDHVATRRTRREPGVRDRDA